MLDDSRQIYEECANLLPNWRQMSKTELANKYIEDPSSDIAQSCFSALVCLYWKMIGAYYSKQNYKIASELDCYDWLIDGIYKALDQHAWTDPLSKLYEDPKGPEKAIVVCILSLRANYYQYTNYDKRKLNYTNLSLDSLEEESSDGYYLPYVDKYETIEDYLYMNVNHFFSVKDYFSAFFLDALFNFNLIVDKKHEYGYNISINKLSHYINSVGDDYCIQFSHEYGLPVEDVKNAFSYLRRMPSYRIHSNLNSNLNRLKKDETLYKLLEES